MKYTTVPGTKTPLQIDPVHYNELLAIFDGFSSEEIRSTIKHLFTLLPERGCVQRCVGCHAGAQAKKSTASWEAISHYIAAINAAIYVYDITIDAEVIEPFRDTDPGHYCFFDSDGNRYRIGDFAELCYNLLGKRCKIMTSGIFAIPASPVRHIAAVDSAFLFDQISKAAPYLSSISLSCSVNTFEYKQNTEQGTTILIDTAREIIRRVHLHAYSVPIYLDIMLYSLDGEDESSQATIALLQEVIQGSNAPTDLLDVIPTLRNHGQRNGKWMTRTGENIGVRYSPFLNLVTQRRERITTGNDLALVSISDWLGIQHELPYEELLEGVKYTTTDLRDYTKRAAFIQLLKTYAQKADGYLGNQAGDVHRLFRTEIDLSPASSYLFDVGQRKILGPRVCFIVSNIAAAEIQDIIPYKPLNLGKIR